MVPADRAIAGIVMCATGNLSLRFDGITTDLRLTAGDIESGYHELPDTDRRLIAQTWLAHFNQGHLQPGTPR